MWEVIGDLRDAKAQEHGDGMRRESRSKKCVMGVMCKARILTRLRAGVYKSILLLSCGIFPQNRAKEDFSIIKEEI
jgi:hypothetical protein